MPKLAAPWLDNQVARSSFRATRLLDAEARRHAARSNNKVARSSSRATRPPDARARRPRALHGLAARSLVTTPPRGSPQASHAKYLPRDASPGRRSPLERGGASQPNHADLLPREATRAAMTEKERKGERGEVTPSCRVSWTPRLVILESREVTPSRCASQKPELAARRRAPRATIRHHQVTHGTSRVTRLPRAGARRPLCITPLGAG